MLRELISAGAVAVLLVAGAPASHASGDDWRTRMLTKVNAARAAVGVAPVQDCAGLDVSAERYARSMARSGVVTHRPSDGTTAADRVAGSGYRAVLVGENLAAGQRTVRWVMRDWRRSPSHYQLLVDPRFTHVGFGRVKVSRGPYRTYWVQHFGVGGRC